jgi:hypothetical protein
MIGLFADNHAFNQGLINYLTERATVLTAIGENAFCPEIGDGDVEGGIPFNYFGRLVCTSFRRMEGKTVETCTYLRDQRLAMRRPSRALPLQQAAAA